MNKYMVYWTIASVLIVVALVSPVWSKGNPKEGEKQTGEPSPVADVKANSQPVGMLADPVKEESEALPFALERVPGGFQLAFDERYSAYGAASVLAGQSVVHLIRVNDQYQALIVQPDTESYKVYPLYEQESDNGLTFQLLERLDDEHVMFIRQTTEGNNTYYDLVRLHVGTGEMQAIAARFWEANGHDSEDAADFIISAHYNAGNESEAGQLLLTSFMGKIWMIDVTDGTVKTGGDNRFLAFGDIGSKPPRALIMPSPDLKRLLYQQPEEHRISVQNHFKLIDSESMAIVRDISINNNLTISDGAVWNEDSSLFYLEYAEREPLQAVYSDNTVTVYAQGVNVYNRDGRLVREIKVPKGSAERMSVYGWLDEDRLLIEYYHPYTNGWGGWKKGVITYKSYQLSTGKLTAYRSIDEASGLREPVLIASPSGYYSKAFVLVDDASKFIWEPGLQGTAYNTDSGLYVTSWRGDAEIMYKWNEKLRSLEWVLGDGVAFLRLMHGNWAIYYSKQGWIYRNLGDAASSGLVLPADFMEERDRGEWRATMSEHTKRPDPGTVRVTGVGRYGSLQLRSIDSEHLLKNGGAYDLFGSYEMQYVDKQGRERSIAHMEGLTLAQETEVATMTAHHFDGFDVLLFQPLQYRFDKGYSDSIKTLMAYAITEDGEAFPLEFLHANNKGGINRLGAITIHDHAPIEMRDGELIVQSQLETGRYELAWLPDTNERALTLTALRDRTEEYHYLGVIAERYAHRLEQALGLEDAYLPEGPMNEERLRNLFTDRAWSNPGFQHLREDFAASKKAGEPSRAFAWNPIDARFDDKGNIRLTFTINLWYAIGLAAHLDALLTVEDFEWSFHDFGTLETEKIAGLAGYNGLRIADKLEHGGRYLLN